MDVFSLLCVTRKMKEGGAPAWVHGSLLVGLCCMWVVVTEDPFKMNPIELMALKLIFVAVWFICMMTADPLTRIGISAVGLTCAPVMRMFPARWNAALTLAFVTSAALMVQAIHHNPRGLIDVRRGRANP